MLLGNPVISYMWEMKTINLLSICKTPILTKAVNDTDVCVSTPPCKLQMFISSVSEETVSILHDILWKMSQNDEFSHILSQDNLY